jgi:hypothetical protein
LLWKQTPFGEEQPLAELNPSRLAEACSMADPIEMM